MQAQRGELRQDVVANTIVVRHAHGVRPHRDLLDVVHRALGGEDGVGRGGRDRAGGARRANDGEGAQCDQRDRGKDSFEIAAEIARCFAWADVDGGSDATGAFPLLVLRFTVSASLYIEAAGLIPVETECPTQRTARRQDESLVVDDDDRPDRPSRACWKRADSPFVRASGTEALDV